MADPNETQDQAEDQDTTTTTDSDTGSENPAYGGVPPQYSDGGSTFEPPNLENSALQNPTVDANTTEEILEGEVPVEDMVQGDSDTVTTLGEVEGPGQTENVEGAVEGDIEPDTDTPTIPEPEPASTPATTFEAEAPDEPSEIEVEAAGAEQQETYDAEPVPPSPIDLEVPEPASSGVTTTVHIEGNYPYKVGDTPVDALGRFALSLVPGYMLTKEAQEVAGAWPDLSVAEKLHYTNSLIMRAGLDAVVVGGTAAIVSTAAMGGRAVNVTTIASTPDDFATAAVANPKLNAVSIEASGPTSAAVKALQQAEQAGANLPTKAGVILRSELSPADLVNLARTDDALKAAGYSTRPLITTTPEELAAVDIDAILNTAKANNIRGLRIDFKVPRPITADEIRQLASDLNVSEWQVKNWIQADIVPPTPQAVADVASTLRVSENQAIEWLMSDPVTAPTKIARIKLIDLRNAANKQGISVQVTERANVPLKPDAKIATGEIMFSADGSLDPLIYNNTPVLTIDPTKPAIKGGVVTPVRDTRAFIINFGAIPGVESEAGVGSAYAESWEIDPLTMELVYSPAETWETDPLSTPGLPPGTASPVADPVEPPEPEEQPDEVPAVVPSTLSPVTEPIDEPGLAEEPTEIPDSTRSPYVEPIDEPEPTKPVVVTEFEEPTTETTTIEEGAAVEIGGGPEEGAEVETWFEAEIGTGPDTEMGLTESVEVEIERAEQTEEKGQPRTTGETRAWADVEITRAEEEKEEEKARPLSEGEPSPLPEPTPTPPKAPPTTGIPTPPGTPGRPPRLPDEITPTVKIARFQLPPGEFARVIGWRQGSWNYYLDRVTGKIEYSRTPKYGLVNDRPGVTPFESLTVITTSKEKPVVNEVPMGIVNARFTEDGISFTKSGRGKRPKFSMGVER